MRRKLGSLVFGAVLMALATLSSPASGDLWCNRECSRQFNVCHDACNSDPGCIMGCQMGFEWCNCYYCNYCP